MIISNPVVKLEYNPSTDVLLFDWPNFTNFTLSEADYVLDTVLETIRSYDVKYLVIDTRKGELEIERSLYKQIKFNFVMGLRRSRLKKLARIIIHETFREELLKKVAKEACFEVPVANFSRIEDALIWLNENKLVEEY